MTSNDWRLARFAFVYFNAQTIIYLIPELASSSNYQGIAGILAGSLLSLAVLFFVVYIGRLQPNASWVNFGKRILGKGLHSAILFLLLIWSVYYASYDIQSFVLFFGANYMQGTPPWFLQLIIAIVVMYAVRLGIRTIVYMSDGIFLLTFSVMLFVFYSYGEKANMQMIPALFHYFDVPTFVENTLATFSVVTEWVVFLFISPEFKFGKGTFNKLAITAAGVCLSVLVAWGFTILNFSPHFARQFQYPFLEFIRSRVNEGFLESMAPFMIGLWTASMFIHCSLLIYAATKCMSYFTKGKGEKMIIPILSLLSAGIAFYYAYHVYVYHEHYFSFTAVLIWVFVELIPVLYGVVAMLRYGSSKGFNKSSQSSR
ncbi:GerAB/ArcD/ProY family transporter [Paenibacillus sp. NPDC058071]|uniref:GerAB/ArcD/ProY family transporter n=1 Tax=Paenibacillus sp. NPDC058071 TaxID=3346326 RepID=UPI0036DDF19B